MSAISDIINSGRDVKYPEKLLKRLGERLGDVAMGKDPAYLDGKLRATVGAFYNKFGEKNFQRSLKDSRKIETLILHFATTAQGQLSSIRASAPAGQEWRNQLDWQVSQFIRIIRDTLAHMRLGYDLIGSNRDVLMGRLDTYIQKLEEAPTNTLTHVSSASTSTLASAPTASSVLTMPVAQLVNQHPEFRTIAALLQVDEPQLLLDLESVRKECTDAAALNDLKHASKNVNLGDVWPGRSTDFEGDEAWKAWKARELDYLSQKIAALCINNPELLTRRGDDPDTAEDKPESTFAPDEFVFIPQHPVRVYLRALHLCLDADLEMIANCDDDSGVETTILTPAHVDLLSSAAEVWRIRTPFIRLAHLQLVLDRCHLQDGPISIPIDCVAAVTMRVQQAIEEQPYDEWMSREQRMLKDAFTHVLKITLEELTRLLQERQLEAGEIYQWAEFAQGVYHFLEDEKDATTLLEAKVEDLRDLIQVSAIQEYVEVATDVFNQGGDHTHQLYKLYKWLHKRTKRLSDQFCDPIFGPRLDLPPLVLEKQVPLYWADLRTYELNVVDEGLREDGTSFESIFDLYKALRDLQKMFKAFCPDTRWEFNTFAFFQPHIEHWLVRTSERTLEWVDNAVRADNFEPIDSIDAYHSSSIDDLFTALHQPVEFIDSLKWTDKYTLALFRTSLAKTVSMAVEQYCHRIEEMFKTEIFAASLPQGGPPSGQGSELMAAWMERAKLTLRGDGDAKNVTFDLQPASCVKLNNIQKARQLLDSVYTKLDADVQARIIVEHGTAVPEDEEFEPAPSKLASRGKEEFLFTVKVVQAEGLLSSSGASTSRLDTYVGLEDEGRRKPLGETRTMCETPDPQWSEAFDIHVDSAMWLTLTVWERKAGTRASCGQTQIKLDPKVFLDMQSHDIWLELNTQGKLLLRISVEKEKDDILFYFGRGFRSLKRAESEMVRMIVDQISIFVRRCLSRDTVKSLVKQPSIVATTAQLNLGRGMNLVKGMAASAWAAAATTSEGVIPPVASSPSVSAPKARKTELTDSDIENAISPLLDFYEQVLATLSENLSPEERTLVLTKVWKQVLVTLQGIILPPLSDEPSDMRQLSHGEVAVVMKWKGFLRNFFLARDADTNEFNGLPPEILFNNRFRELDEYETLHDLSTDELMQQCARAMQTSLRQQAGSGRLGRSKSVMNQRSLGTIKKRKAQKKEHDDFSNEDVILRLLRYVTPSPF